MHARKTVIEWKFDMHGIKEMSLTYILVPNHSKLRMQLQHAHSMVLKHT